jgi:hypothetical protein
MADRCARLLVLQQCAIGNAWLKALEAEGTPAARERLQALLAAAGQALLVDDESAALYHLDPAVPILTTAPEGPPEPPATAPANPSAPANGPATGPGTSDHPTTDTSVAP